MSSIKYAGLTISIEEREELDGNMGRYKENKATITLDKDMPEDLKRSTLVHECVHMILTKAGEGKLNNDEGFVERLANGIFDLYENNHEVLLGVEKEKSDSFNEIVKDPTSDIVLYNEVVDLETEEALTSWYAGDPEHIKEGN